MSPLRAPLSALLPTLLLLSSVARAGSTDPVYRTPDPVIADIVTTPYTPFVRMTSDQEWMLLMDRASLPGIEELSEPEVKLAGTRINPRIFGPSRVTPIAGYRLLRMDDASLHEVKGLPGNPKLVYSNGSPDGRRMSFVNMTAEGLELWVLDIDRAQARRLVGPRLNLTAQVRPQWLDNESIVCTLRPDGQGAAPARSHVPTGPVLQENLGEKSPARTYQDLLSDAHDEALFDYYFTAQLARVDLKGKISPLGDPGIIDDFEPSPDGRYVRVEMLHRPYSYVVPASRFPRRVEILDRDGRPVHEVADLPLQDRIPVTFSSVEAGPRDFEWRADAPATLVWAEALDGGDAGVEADERDRLYFLPAPFDGEPVAWMSTQYRFGSVRWGSAEVALVSEWWWETRLVRTWNANPSDPAAGARLVWERSWEDRYGDPGDPVLEPNEFGRDVLLITNGRLHLVGTGASPEGDRPFYDTLELATGETVRHFRSEAPYYDLPQDPLGEDGKELLVRRESVEEVPNYFVRNLETGEMRQLTDFPHPSPQLKGLHKELITYARADGVQLSGTLYLPPGYDAERDGPLPTVMWAYPDEFKDADHAGQVKDSPYRFDRVGWWSPLLYLLHGYAVLDNPAMPIVGEDAEEPNDTFREQLVASAKAAVDEVVRRGVAREDAIAIGGHSYGAFMTANLLAHSDLFAAGIARSGAYNRTLTPFGFQSEERTIWQAPEVYFDMSPFMHAEKVNEPLLLIHGDADNNAGTYPMQSERYYAALKGLGATTRLVMLPAESHGYRARESILHMLWEQEEWLDEYVKREMTEEESGATR
jgi:dipeptidyl aminopeptidase/acylaminoacyl peptidase